MRMVPGVRVCRIVYVWIILQERAVGRGLIVKWMEMGLLNSVLFDKIQEG